MKKIVLSLAVIAVVATVAIGVTRAYFSDTETSTGNTFTAGTLDISVNSQNPWSQNGQYSFANLEPSDSKDINVTLQNTGTNPVVIWKKVKVTETDTLSTQFIYSMKIGGNDNIKKAWGVKVSDVNDLWIPIGRLNAGDTLAVDQNYYFNETAGNEYQGKTMTIDITFYADQVDAPGPAHTTRGVVLENKNASSGTWEPITGDGTWGILTWDTGGNYTVKAWGLAAGTYQLDYFVEPSTNNFFGSTFTVPAGGSVSATGTRIALTTDTNAKYWLRDLSWNNDNTLWESNLVN